MQLSTERVVFAIRAIHEATDRPVSVVGYSQGGAAARFALRFWPDLRPMVDDLVLIASAVSGTNAATVLCANGCAPALQQFEPGSRFLAALSSRALRFPGIDYTSVYSILDEVVTTSAVGAASMLDGATNVAVQDICPADTADHDEIGTVDPVAFAVAFDAITHDGPARVYRLPAALCDEVYLPGLDEAAVVDGKRRLSQLTFAAYRDTPIVTDEPELRCYVTASCTETATSETFPTDSDEDDSLRVWRIGGLLLLILGVGGSTAAIVRHRQDLARRRGSS